MITACSKEQTRSQPDRWEEQMEVCMCGLRVMVCDVLGQSNNSSQKQIK